MSALKQIMKEYDEAKDDHSWDKDHPIFLMAEHIDWLSKRARALQWLEDNKAYLVTRSNKTGERHVSNALDRRFSGETLLEAIEAAMESE